VHDGPEASICLLNNSTVGALSPMIVYRCPIKHRPRVPRDKRCEFHLGLLICVYAVY
jgi:hypothetical protein